ncbi:MAG: flagellin [Myxococcales bacterium]|nr:flagellin [Myxococcales bacterium]
MGLFVNTNVASINAQRNLAASGRLVNRAYQRLSSGLRINSAKDDAAGLSISTRFTSQIRGLNQAARNTGDGLSMAQTIEGALQETTNILQRIRELSVQAASDINTEADRASLDDEVQALIEELDRIGETTTFNNQHVLNGEFVQSFFHVGANAWETIAVSVKDARPLSLGRAAVVTSVQVGTDALAKDANPILINGITLRSTSAVDDTVSTSFATGSAIAKANAINDIAELTGVRVRALTTLDEANDDVTAGTLDQANYLQINGEVIIGFAVQEDDADGELVAQINAVVDKTGVVASLDANYRVVLSAVDGRNIEVQAVGNAANITGLGAGVTTARLEFTSTDQFFIRAPAVADLNRIGFQVEQLVGVQNSQAMQSVDVRTRDTANRAIEVVDRALEQVSRDRSRLGAVQNRLESTISNLSTISENMSASRSRILDADFAGESAELARNQILQQAGTTILAQANQNTQAALSLLQ